MKNKLAYLHLIVSLRIGYLLTIYFRIFSFLVVKSKPQHDLILFPYSQIGDIGYTVRFEAYLSHLDKDGISYNICHLYNEELLSKQLDGSPADRYRLYRKIFWIRLKQVLSAKNYKAAFVQRGLFAFYPDQKTPYLEMLLNKMCTNTTYDFWDSVWHFNPDLVEKTVKNAKKISVVNSYLQEQFEKLYGISNSSLFPIGVDQNKYKTKENYKSTDEIKLFYTGLPGNVKKFLDLYEEVIRKLSTKHNIKLVFATKARLEIDGIKTEFHSFNENTFFELMKNCDIGLYAIEDNSYTRGKMAMKVLDYMATGLPIVACSAGLTPFAMDNENLLIADNEELRLSQLEKLINDETLRKKLGMAAQETIKKHHTIVSSYELFKEIVFS